MSAVWTIKRERAGQADVTRTLEDWDIKSANIRLISRELDTFTLVQTLPIDQADDFANRDILRLYRDGVQVFMGRVLKPTCIGAAGTEQRGTLVAGPWWYAQNAAATQDWRGGPDLEVRKVTWLTLYVKFGEAAPTIATAIQQLITDLQLLGAPLTLGTIDARGTPPPKLDENVTFAEAVFLALEEVIDTVTWFDYSLTNPAFNARDPELLTPLSLAVDGSEVPAGAPRVETFDVARHDNDEVPFVNIIIKSKTEVPELTEEGAGYRSDYQDNQFPAAPADVFGGVTVVLEKTDPMDDWNPLEFAQRCYEAYRSVLWRGSVVMVGDDIDARLRPGVRLNFTGGLTAWETMDGIVQQVDHDIFAGRTTATFGPPTQLSPSGYIDKLITLRRAKHATNDNKRDQNDGYTANFDGEKNDEVGARLSVVLGVQINGIQEPKLVQLPKSASARDLPA